MGTGEVDKALYGEEKLKLVLLYKEGMERTQERKGAGSSSGKNDWDAQMLVDGGEGVSVRDDETLNGGI